MVHSLPVAACLKRGRPGIEVLWLVSPRFAPVVELCSSVDQVLLKPKKLLDLPAVVRQAGPFDLALDVQGLFVSGLAVGLSRAPLRYGYHWQREFSGLFSRKVLPDPTSFHVVDQYMDVARAAGGQGEQAEFCLSPRAEDVERMRQVLREAGWQGGPFVACNPGTAWATKCWPVERFAQLAQQLDEKGVQTGFLGAKPERERFEQIRALASCPVLDLVEKTNIGELIAMISLAAAHVGGDTGSTHIAAALSVPAVGLYSITNPLRTCPYGQIDRCLYDPRGMDRIDAQPVATLVCDALGLE